MASMTQGDTVALDFLSDKATQLRIDSVRATTAAGSGHPTSCASAAEIMSVLFFSVMRYDPTHPKDPANDRFVLSKGHAAPILYAAWAEAGLFPREQLLTLRQLDSDLEGHPTPRLPFVDAATGSLGQGLSVGLGLALGAPDTRVYVLLGDGETAEGSIWETAELAGFYRIGNLCATVDVNRLGQSGPTMLQHQMDIYRARFEAFGWNALIVDGHDIPALLEAYESAAHTTDRPTVVLAQTIKGKGFPGIEDKEGWHGKPLDAATADAVIAALEANRHQVNESWTPHLPMIHGTAATPPAVTMSRAPYTVGGKRISTRRGFGDALAELAKIDQRVFVLDGDVRNSTYTEEAERSAPKHFVEGYIAEQNMVGMAIGLSARGRIPFAATFSCFLSRAYDFVRMASIGHNNVKLAGTHSGVSIGEDGPSQMGLEDLAQMCAQPDMTVLYPADATAAWEATRLAATVRGPCYVRLGRPESDVIYSPETPFAIGKCQVLRESANDRALIVAGGVTVFEALAAYEIMRGDGIEVRVIDLFSVQPIDADTLITAARGAGGIVVTVEDHYAHGGLGDAVCAALSEERVLLKKLAVREIPHSGKPADLLDRYGISARHIVGTLEEIL
jgi:transketolase